MLPQLGAAYQQVGPDTYYSQAFGATFKFVRAGDAIVGLSVIQAAADHTGRSPRRVRQPAVAQLPPAFPPALGLDRATLQQYVGTYPSTVGHSP